MADIVKDTAPIYRLASQYNDGEPIEVRSIRMGVEGGVIPFAERILGKKLSDMAFAEIHRIDIDGTTGVVYGSLDSNWPKAVIKNYDGYHCPKPPSSAAISDPLLNNDGEDEFVYGSIHGDFWRKVA